MPTKKKVSKAPVKVPSSLLGGKATLKKYGKKFYSDMAKKRWAKQRRAEKAAQKATAR